MQRLALLPLLTLLNTVGCSDISNTCPSELPESDQHHLIGYRLDNDTCVSYVTVDWEQWNKTTDFNDLWGKICNPVQGKPYALYDLKAVPQVLANQKVIRAFSGFFTTNVTMGEFAGGLAWWYYDFWFTMHSFEDNLTEVMEYKKNFQLYGPYLRWFKVWINKDVSDPDLNSFYVGDYYPIYAEWYMRPIDPQYPLFFVHNITNNGTTIQMDKPILADKARGDPKRPEYVNCQHKPSKNCIQHIVEACHLDTKLNKWIDKMVIITQQREEPWGMRCPSVNLEKISQSCTQTCEGQWSEWTAEPEVKCNNATVHRYRPVKKGDPPCYFPSPSCCVDQKVNTYSAKCSDFAYNSTINLRAEGCKNNIQPTMGSMGHLECVCGERYSGIQCEIDSCAKRCENYVDCLPVTGNKAICICEAGYGGPTCTIKKKKCGQNGICLNGGTCKEESGNVGAHCICKTDFGGEACERKAEGCDALPCSDRGICYDDKVRNSFKCHCLANFTGDRCELKSTDSDSVAEKSSSMELIAIGVAAFAVFFACFAVVFFMRKRKKSGRHRDSSISISESIFSILKRKGKKKRKICSKSQRSTSIADRSRKTRVRYISRL